MIDTLYVITTHQCNLKCPHCDIRLRDDFYDRDKFISSLQKYRDCDMIIFGGEPTLHFDRIQLICQYGSPTSISTNLLTITPQLIDVIKQHDLGVATSWNPKRFHGTQYNRWIDNLKVLANNDIKAKVLVTLTDDLIAFDLNKLLDMFDQWSQTGGLSSIQFEPLVDGTKNQTFYDQVDQWLFDVDQLWRPTIVENYIVNQLNQWHFDCSRTYSLLPSGDIMFGCPQNNIGTQINMQCFNCEFVNVCQPCRLQKCCTFPKRLYKKYYD